MHLYSGLAAEFCGGALGSSGVVLREVVGVAKLLFTLREHYGVAGGNERAEVGDRVRVRSYVLLIVRRFVSTDKGIFEEEMESLLSYLATVPEV